MPSFYEIVFGDDIDPGKEKALDLFVKLFRSDYEKVEEFRSCLRERTAGGEYTVSCRRQRAEVLEREARLLRSRNDAQKTLDTEFEAVSLRGGLTVAACSSIANALISHERCDLAAAVMISAIDSLSEPTFVFTRTHIKFLSEAYFLMGYDKIYRKELGSVALADRQLRQVLCFEVATPKWSFDDTDIERTVDCLMLIEDSDDWWGNLFPINHIRMHLRLRDRDFCASKALLSGRVNFAKRIKQCEAAINLLQRADMATLKLEEAYFISSFCTVFAHLFDISTVFTKEITSEKWYQDFVTSFWGKLVSVESAQRLAKADRGFSCHLLMAFFEFSRPYLCRIFDRDDLTVPSPFNELSWYSKAMMIPILAGCETTKRCCFRVWSETILNGLIKNFSKKNFRMQITDSSQESFIKSLDMLYLVAVFSTFVDKHLPPSSINVTQMSVSVLRSCLIFKIFDNFDMRNGFISTFGFLINYLNRFKNGLSQFRLTGFCVTILAVLADLLELLLKEENPDVPCCFLSNCPKIVRLLNKLVGPRTFTCDREILTLVKSLQAKALTKSVA